MGNIELKLESYETPDYELDDEIKDYFEAES